ncbi:MAG: hypothetical protein WKG06_26690 [Segetibacter sp.]
MKEIKNLDDLLFHEIQVLYAGEELLLNNIWTRPKYISKGLKRRQNTLK